MERDGEPANMKKDKRAHEPLRAAGLCPAHLV